MSETFAEDKNLNTDAVESKNSQINVLEEMKSNVITDKKCREVDNKTKMLSKNIQVDFKEELPEGGIVHDIKHETYWQELAEAKRIALEKALKENERLCIIKENLTQKNIHYQKLLQESSSFVEVVMAMLNKSPDDTGIDVNDSQNE